VEGKSKKVKGKSEDRAFAAPAFSSSLLFAAFDTPSLLLPFAFLLLP
jgi:hypothetical protein